MPCLANLVLLPLGHRSSSVLLSNSTDKIRAAAGVGDTAVIMQVDDGDNKNEVVEELRGVGRGLVISMDQVSFWENAEFDVDEK